VATKTALPPARSRPGLGLRSGDVIARANGRSMEGPADWQRLRVHLDPSRPLDLEIARTEGTLAVSLPRRSGLGEWGSVRRARV
jgi:S1-C subfamily serine protease